MFPNLYITVLNSIYDEIFYAYEETYFFVKM